MTYTYAYGLQVSPKFITLFNPANLASDTVVSCVEFSITSAYDSEYRSVTAERFFHFCAAL